MGRQNVRVHIHCMYKSFTTSQKQARSSTCDGFRECFWSEITGLTYWRLVTVLVCRLDNRKDNSGLRVCRYYEVSSYSVRPSSHPHATGTRRFWVQSCCSTWNSLWCFSVHLMQKDFREVCLGKTTPNCSNARASKSRSFAETQARPCTFDRCKKYLWSKTGGFPCQSWCEFWSAILSCWTANQIFE